MSGGRERRDGQERPVPSCSRAARLVDRIVAGSVTADDRGHAQSCRDCGPLLARAARFDDELRRTARGFVVEELPRGILDPALGRGGVGFRGGTSTRSFAPGLAGFAAALAVLVVSAAVVLAPGGLGGPTDSPPVETSFQSTLPAFHSSADIAADLRDLGYECFPGIALPSAPAGDVVREGVVCATTKAQDEYLAKLVTRESIDGEVLEITINGGLLGTDTETSVENLTTAIAKLAFISMRDPVIGGQAGDWVLLAIPKLRVLPSGDVATTEIGGVGFTADRNPAGSYRLFLAPLLGG